MYGSLSFALKQLIPKTQFLGSGATAAIRDNKALMRMVPFLCCFLRHVSQQVLMHVPLIVLFVLVNYKAMVSDSTFIVAARSYGRYTQ